MDLYLLLCTTESRKLRKPLKYPLDDP